MGDELARRVDAVEVTETQRTRFLEILAAEKMTGDAKALRQAGVAGTTGQLRAYAREHLADDAREARGWSLTKVENALFEVACNTEHPSFERAAGRVLKAYHPAYRDNAQLEVTGANGGPVQIEKREVSLTGVLHVLAEAGALPDELAGPLRHLAAARDVLPAQPD